jgi:uncharacterized protein (UPF0303 family)
MHKFFWETYYHGIYSKMNNYTAWRCGSDAQEYSFSTGFFPCSVEQADNQIPISYFLEIHADWMSLVSGN